MNREMLIESLRQSGPAIVNLVSELSPEDATWRPAPEAWSVVEIINHLADEEREDFGMRLDVILTRHGEDWPPIDPQSWVTQREYQARDLAESLDRFRTDRDKSLAWLHDLPPGLAWDRSHSQGTLTLRAGDIAAAWAAHDLIHLRQLTRRRYELLVERIEPFNTRYSGPW